MEGGIRATPKCEGQKCRKLFPGVADSWIRRFEAGLVEHACKIVSWVGFIQNLGCLQSSYIAGLIVPQQSERGVLSKDDTWNSHEPTVS